MAATQTFYTGVNGILTDVTLSPSGTTAYIANEGGQVTAVNVVTGQQIGSWKVGTFLTGMDVSSDGRYLVVGERALVDQTGDQWSLKAKAVVHRLDLQTGEVKDFTTEVTGYDRHFYDVAWGNDGKVLLTQNFGGSGFTSLWTLDPVTGQFDKSTMTYPQDGVLTASEDGSKILFGPQNSSGGSLYVYDVATKTTTWALSNSGYNNGMQAISIKGGMLVQSLYTQITVYDLNYKLLIDLTKAHPDLRGYVGGVVFSADGAKLFVLDTRFDRVLQFSTTDWIIERSIGLGVDAGDSYNGTGAYGDRLSLTADGLYLVAFSGQSFGIVGPNTLTAIDLRAAWDGGSDKADVFSGDDAANKLFGYAGNDVIDGKGGDDTLYGGDGDDTLIGGSGDDTLYGGAGVDTADYGGAVAGVSVDLMFGATLTTAGAGRDILTEIENLTGSAFADKLSGTDSANVLDGGAGDDLLTGRGGADTLRGGEGDDVLIGGVGDDVLDGGAGFDVASYEDAMAGVTVDLALGTARQNTRGAGVDQLAGVEGLKGSNFVDVLKGDAGDNTFQGGAGDDIIDGAGGVDTAIYAKASSNYSWTRGANGTWTVRDLGAANGEGADTLLNVEFLRFSDRTVVLSPSGTDVKVGDLVTTGAVRAISTSPYRDAMLSADAKTVFVSDGEGYVLSLNALTGELQGRWKVGTQLGGMDLSPDGRYLVATEQTIVDVPAPPGYVTSKVTVHKLDLTTGQVTDYSTETQGYGRGFYDAAWGKDGKVLLSQSFAGSGWGSGWTLDMATGEFASGQSYQQDALFSVSEDRSFILVSGYNDIYIHDVAKGAAARATGVSGGTASFSVAAKLIAMVGYSQFSIYDFSGALVADMTSKNPDMRYNVGAAEFSADGSKLFILDTLYGRVEQISTTDWSIERSISLGVDIRNLYISGSAYGDRLMVSADGRTLMVLTDQAVLTIDVTATWEPGSDRSESITGGDAAETLFGYGGADVIDGGRGDDVLQGGMGDDRLIGGEGDDMLDGGFGVDTADYSGATSGVTVALNYYGAQDTHGAGRDTLSLVENLIGSAFDDTLRGDAYLNRLEGRGGDDLLIAEGIADTFDGGAGFDTVSYEYMTGPVTVDLSVSWGQETRTGGQAVLMNVEALKGSAFDDVLAGNGEANTLEGGAGKDALNGGGGDDVLIGGAGDDTIDGGAGEDTARYAGKQTDYSVVRNGDGSTTVSDLRAGAPDGVDRLVNVEKILFGPIPSASVIATEISSILRQPNTSAALWTLAQDLLTKWTAGQLTAEQVTAQIVDAADATTSVASMNYQFFTGKIPSQVGIDYLVSPTGPNPANLNSAYYAQFNTVNRYINFAVNLGKGGEAKDSFAAKYGAMSLFDATREAYKTIFGGTPTDEKVHSLIDTRVGFLAIFGGDGPEGIGTKAAMVGFLLAAAATENIGVMAKANEAWLTDLSDGQAPFAVDILDPAKGYYKADFIFGG